MGLSAREPRHANFFSGLRGESTWRDKHAMKAVIVALCLVRHAAAFGYFVDDHTTCSGCEDYD